MHLTDNKSYLGDRPLSQQAYEAYVLTKLRNKGTTLETLCGECVRVRMKRYCDYDESLTTMNISVWAQTAAFFSLVWQWVHTAGSVLGIRLTSWQDGSGVFPGIWWHCWCNLLLTQSTVDNKVSCLCERKSAQFLHLLGHQTKLLSFTCGFARSENINGFLNTFHICPK